MTGKEKKHKSIFRVNLKCFVKKKKKSHGGGTHKGDCGTVNTPKRLTVKGRKQLCKQVTTGQCHTVVRAEPQLQLRRWWAKPSYCCEWQ